MLPFFSKDGRMDQDPQPRRRRLNLFGRTERRKRIFARLSEGWAYDEIAAEEGVTGERVRQMVSEALAKRVISQGEEYARLQLVRLLPALRIAGEAVARGELKAIAPLIKVLDRLDKHQTGFLKKHNYEGARQKLLDKLNRMYANLQSAREVEAAASSDAQGEAPPEAEPAAAGESWGQEILSAREPPPTP